MAQMQYTAADFRHGVSWDFEIATSHSDDQRDTCSMLLSAVSLFKADLRTLFLPTVPRYDVVGTDVAQPETSVHAESEASFKRSPSPHGSARGHPCRSSRAGSAPHEVTRAPTRPSCTVAPKGPRVDQVGSAQQSVQGPRAGQVARLRPTFDKKKRGFLSRAASAWTGTTEPVRQAATKGHLTRRRPRHGQCRPGQRSRARGRPPHARCRTIQRSRR